MVPQGSQPEAYWRPRPAMASARRAHSVEMSGDDGGEMSLAPIVSVHRSVSQLDDSIFSVWEQNSGGVPLELIFWNDYGLRRVRADPELGVVPQFPSVIAEG